MDPATTNATSWGLSKGTFFLFKDTAHRLGRPIAEHGARLTIEDVPNRARIRARRDNRAKGEHKHAQSNRQAAAEVSCRRHVGRCRSSRRVRSRALGSGDYIAPILVRAVFRYGWPQSASPRQSPHCPQATRLRSTWLCLDEWTWALLWTEH
jgi:hypothetical protein